MKTEWGYRMLLILKKQSDPAGRITGFLKDAICQLCTSSPAIPGGMWRGYFWQSYDLRIEESFRYNDDSTEISEIETANFIEKKSVPLDADVVVKVLSEKRSPRINFTMSG